MVTNQSETMSDTNSSPPISTKSTARERKYRTVKTSFRNGILQEYGSVKFSKIGDEDPLLYAYSRRSKAILQAKALRHLDKTLGLGPEPYREKNDLNLKERRKRANRLTYENGVIGNNAVQECIKDLFLGYEVRRVSQELKLSRLQNVNAQLEKQVEELRKKKTCHDTLREEKVGCVQMHQITLEAPNQAFRKEQTMAPQENLCREMRLGIANTRETCSIPCRRTCPTALQSAFTAGSDQAHEVKNQTKQSSAITHEDHMALSPQNQLSQQQRAYYFGNQQAGVFQPHHQQPSQHQAADPQGMCSMKNQGVMISRSQPYYPPLNIQGSPQEVFLPVNQSPQYFFHHGQTPYVPGPNYSNQNYNAANQIVDLGRQNTFLQVMCPSLHPQTPVEITRQMAIAQNVNREGGGIMMPGNPVMQNGQIPVVVPHWNAMIPVAPSDALSPNFHSRT